MRVNLAGSPVVSWLRRGTLDWSLAHYARGCDLEFHEHAETQIHFLLCGSFVEYWPKCAHAVLGPFAGLLPARAPHRNAWGEGGALILTAHLGAKWAGAHWHGWRAMSDVAPIVDRLAAAQGSSDLAECLRTARSLSSERSATEDSAANLLEFAPCRKISSLARRRESTPSAYSRSIKRETGMPPVRLRLEAQLARAVEKIVRTDVGFAHIAQACGFSDQAHLTRTMRARSGMTPGALRRTMYAGKA